MIGRTRPSAIIGHTLSTTSATTSLLLLGPSTGRARSAVAITPARLAEQLGHVQFALDAALHADDDHPAVVGERVDVAVEVGGAHDVEDHVGARAVRRLAHPLDEILFAVVDQDLRAEFLAEVELSTSTPPSPPPGSRAPAPPGWRGCRSHWRRREAAPSGPPTGPRSSPGSTTPCTPPRAARPRGEARRCPAPASSDPAAPRRTRRNRRPPAKRRPVARSTTGRPRSPTSAMVAGDLEPEDLACSRRGRILACGL